ncbi:unnamed protein product [Bursaphelenchus xylophilus]|uniref:Protein KRI1 homolog n=1 Tax=Bursaphelenchus xylophilus TaxID=6326 RepID=A0A1I7SV74_BURXY|nr:unnamed protein product [Bursaphelenchus xylophilus]CAG9101009.1 unnamed protein product [Bursaphelenchus xylophilus]
MQEGELKELVQGIPIPVMIVEMSKKKLLDLGDDDGEDLSINVNPDYAERYENWRQREELQKLKDKYGSDVEDEEDEESTDGEVEWDSEDEKDFLRTLGALKSNDPKIYKSDVKFFDQERQRKPRKPETSAQKRAKEEKMTLRDYEHKLVVERGGKFSDDEEEEEPPNDPSYYQKEQQLKSEFKKALGEDSESDEELLKPREKTKEEEKREENEYYEWLANHKELDNVDEDLKHLKEKWNSNDLTAEDKFLRDYLLNKRYETDGKHIPEALPTYDEVVKVDEELEKVEEFEYKYNFRFEDPDQEFIKQFPRTVKESLRKEDTRRKEARERVKQRKEEEKKQKKEEIKRLKLLKKMEIEDKLKKLKEVTKDDIPISLEDLQKDFDPAEYDRKMKEIFNDYDDKADEDEEKPVFSDISDIDDDEEVDEDDAKPEKVEDNHEQEEEAGPSNSEPSRREKISARKHKRNSKFNEVITKKKPAFDPNEKTFEEYFNEYYALDYEDIIADNLKTKFKYRNVEPNDFGLSTDEILELDDKKLNAWVSVKKVTSYRSAAEEKTDKIVYQKKAQNPERKRKIFGSVVVEDEKKKKKAPVNEIQPENPPETTEKQEEKTKKNRKKRKSRNELSKNRLKAYGVSTTKLKSHLNKDKFKKKEKKS